MVFRLCPAQQGPEAFRKSWCPSWPQEGLRLCTLILCEPLAVCSGPGIVLALHAGRCEMTEAGLRNRYFWEFCIPVLSYTMSKNNSIISLHFPVLICRRKEHAVKQVLMQRHNLRNAKGPVCTVLGCWYGCGLSWLLLKVYVPPVSIPMAEQSRYPELDGKCGCHSRNDGISYILCLLTAQITDLSE